MRQFRGKHGIKVCQDCGSSMRDSKHHALCNPCHRIYKSKGLSTAPDLLWNQSNRRVSQNQLEHETGIEIDW